MVWKLAEAKNRLSELVTRATTEGPQTIRRHGDFVCLHLENTTRLGGNYFVVHLFEDAD